MMVGYETVYQIQNGTVNFGKTIDHLPHFRTVRSEVPADLDKYPASNLLEAISAKLYEEVHKKIHLEDVRSQINRHILNKRLTTISGLFKSTIFKVLRSNPFYSDDSNVVHFDTTNFNVSINVLGSLRIAKKFLKGMAENSVMTKILKF